MILAQVIMVATLLLVASGRAPIYLTAFLGSGLAAVAAGFPLGGKEAITITKLLNGSLNTVIVDMAGVLMFIGVMSKTGFLDVVIHKVMQIGVRFGGAPGVTGAGALVAGIIGALTGFTQPAVTASVTGPAAVKMGMDPNKTAGMAGHAGHFGNFAGFTHPTQVAVIATAAIGFGVINLVGAVTGIAIIMCSYFRLQKELKAEGKVMTEAQLAEIEDTLKSEYDISFGKAVAPFALFFIGFVAGFPIFIVGFLAAILTILLAKEELTLGENAMIEGVQKIAIPLVASVGFLFMSAVMNKIGLVKTITDLFGPVIQASPVIAMLVVSSLAGFLTQSNAAAGGIIIPFLQVVLKTGADPLTVACAAAGGSAVWQYYLSGGPLAALSTAIAVVPGSELKEANKFQRPSIAFGFVALCICIAVVAILH